MPSTTLGRTARLVGFSLMGVAARVLCAFPSPIWRLPAALLAGALLIVDRDTYRISAALLPSIGQAPTPFACLRLSWQRCYQRSADIILIVQSARLNSRWAARYVRQTGTLPADGAILVAPHHTSVPVGLLRLAGLS